MANKKLQSKQKIPLESTVDFKTEKSALSRFTRKFKVLRLTLRT